MYSKANLIDDNTPTDPESIFQKGSTTYYHSTKLFPTKIRKDVTTLYCFVRVVDDFVDAVPQDLESFNNFKSDYYKALSGKEVNNSIISNYIYINDVFCYFAALTSHSLSVNFSKINGNGHI